MTRAYNLQLFFSYLFRVCPLNSHALDLHEVALQLEQWRVGQERTIRKREEDQESRQKYETHQGDCMGQESPNREETKVNTRKNAEVTQKEAGMDRERRIVPKVLERLQTNIDVQLLKQLLEKFRSIFLKSEVCRCESNECLLQLAKAFVWLGGAKYLIPSLLLHGDPQLKVVVLQLLIAFPQIGSIVSASNCKGPMNANFIKECIDVQTAMVELFKKEKDAAIQKLMSYRDAELKETVTIINQEEAKLWDMPSYATVRKGSRVLEQDFFHRHSFTFSRPSLSGMNRSTSPIPPTPIHSPMSVPLLMSWENVSTDFISWILFLCEEASLSIPVVNFCVFYLTHPLDTEYVASIPRPASELSLRVARFADIIPSVSVVSPRSKRSPRQLAKTPGVRLSGFAKCETSFISNIHLLYVILNQSAKAPGLVIVQMLEQITYLLLSDPTNVSVVVSLPNWYLLLLHLLMTGNHDIVISVEKQIARLVINIFVLGLFYHFIKSQTFSKTLYEMLNEIRSELGWNHDSVVMIRLILYSLLCKIQSSQSDFIFIPTHNAWLNIFALIDFIHVYSCKLPVQLKVAKLLATKSELDNFFRFGIHFDKNGECSDLMIYHKLSCLLHSFQISDWKTNVKDFMNNADISNGTLSLFSSTYRTFKPLIKAIALKGFFFCLVVLESRDCKSKVH